MYSLRLFGGPVLVGPSGPIAGRASQPRQLAVLAFLATSGDGGRRRDTIVACLWPEARPDSARHALADAVYRLRSSLGDDVLIQSGDTLRLNPQMIDTDVGCFEAALAGGRMEEALRICRGPFLDGFYLKASPSFDQWKDTERRRFNAGLERALEDLGTQAMAEGRFVDAVEWWRRYAAHDPLNSRVVRQRMEALVAYGDPANAIRCCQEHIDFLKEELGVSPPADLSDLHNRLRAGRTGSSRPSAEVDLEPQVNPVPLRQTPSGGLPQEPACFVGRNQELSRLNVLLTRAVSGDGRVVFITGEAGTGKTTLAWEFCRRATEAHPYLVVAGGHGNAHTGSGDPYHPFREILALLTGDVEARLAAGSLTEEEARRLRNLLPVSAEALKSDGADLIGTFLDASALRSRLSRIPSAKEGRVEILLQWLDELPPRLVPIQSALYDQYLRLVRRVARRFPLLLVLDDLQWADSGTVDLLFHLGRELSGTRVLLLGLFRPSDLAMGRDAQRHPLGSVLNEIRELFGEDDLHLAGEQDRDFVDALLDSEPNDLGRAFRNELFNRTGGHALFTVELTRSLQDRGWIAPNADGRWAADPALDWGALPSRVEAVLGERLSRLPEDLTRVLEIASVEGEWFTLETVAHVLGVSPEELLPRVSRDLEKRHRLVRAHGVRDIGGDRASIFRFRHILFQQYLYHQLDEVERVFLHEQVGRALEIHYGDQRQQITLQLARHFSTRGLPEETVEYLGMAGREAIARGAPLEALGQYNTALEALLAQDRSVQRDYAEARLRLGLGNTLLSLGRPEAADAYDRAVTLARSTGATNELFWALYCLNFSRGHYGGDYHLGQRLSAQCLDAANRDGDSTHLVHAYEAVGRNALMRGDLNAAVDSFERVLSLYDPAIHRKGTLWTGGFDLGSFDQATLGLTYWILGYPDRAKQKSRRAFADVRKLEDRFTLTSVILYEAFLHLWCGDLAAMGDACHALRRAAANAGATEHLMPLVLILEGCVLARGGSPVEGIDSIRRGMASYRAAGWRAWEAYYTGLLAQALADVGRADEGLELLGKVQPRAHESGDRCHEAEVRRIEGDLLLALDPPRPEEAEAAFRQAIEVAKAQKAKSYELRATVSLARLLQNQGRREEIAQPLHAAYAWFTEGFDTQDLVEAKELITALEAGY